MYQGSREYSAIQNAAQNLVLGNSNRGYSGYKDYRNGNNYNNQNYNYNNQFNPNIISSETSRLDELDILDKYSQPLLQRQGADLMGNVSAIQLGSKANQQLNIRGASANVRSSNPQPIIIHSHPPPPLQQPYPSEYMHPQIYKSNRKRDSSNDVQKALQQQMEKQNDILSQLVNNIDRKQQIYQPPPTQPDYNYRIKEIEKEYSMMNEIQNLRREITQIQTQKNQMNPMLQQQQQQQQQMQMMGMQQMMMNPYSNPMMMMLMNQLAPPNSNNQQPPYQQQFPPPYPPNPYSYPYPPYNQYPPPPPPQQNNDKRDQDNRLEELLKDLLKEKALNNAIKNEGLDKTFPKNDPTIRNSISSRRSQNNNGMDYMVYTDPDQPIEQRYNTQHSQMSQLKNKKKDIKRVKRIIGLFVLFIRWIKLQVLESKKQFKLYEMEEFKSDYTKVSEAANSWLVNCSTKGFNSIIANCKKEQDIVDVSAKKLNPKEQDLRFTNYTQDCDFLIDEIIRGLQSIPEDVSYFIVKKFYDNSYFTNDPPFLFQFEIDRLEFDPNDQKLIEVENNPQRQKMLLLLFIFTKIYIPQILISPWLQKLDPSLRFIENYITLKKLAIMCSIFYHSIIDQLRTVPLVQRPSNVETWKAIPKTTGVNNNNKINLELSDSTKDEILTLLVPKDQLTTFYSKREQWLESFKKKLDEFASTFIQKLKLNRSTYLELRKEFLQDKAKELQKFIPAKLRNVQI